jgi:hypothetical protein
VQKRLGNSEAFRIFMNDERRPDDINDQTGEFTPFLIGLRQIFSEQISGYQRSLR